MVKDSRAVIAPTGTAVGRPTSTARRLVDASVSANTRSAYAGALGRLDAWLDGQKLDDAALAAYLAERRDGGRRGALPGPPRRGAESRRRGYCQSPRRLPPNYRRARPRPGAPVHGRGPGGRARHVPPAARGRLDAVIAGLLFMGGLRRRSEVSALRWADVADAGDADGILVTVRRSKTNQVGETSDVRYLKNGAARSRRPGARGPCGSALAADGGGLRFTAAAEAAGLDRRVTAHSGRVGLASELTSRGASTTDVMLAGNWKTLRMVTHCSAGATAERGAVARYL